MIICTFKVTYRGYHANKDPCYSHGYVVRGECHTQPKGTQCVLHGDVNISATKPMHWDIFKKYIYNFPEFPGSKIVTI